MKRKPYAALQRLLKAKRWKEALAQVDALLAANPLAAQLYLLRGQLIQLQGESTAYTLDDAAAAFKRALELDGTYFEALVELMHFYDAVCADPPQAIAYAKQVKALAQKALDAASAVLDDTTVHVA
jgi:tetratricopeptide (TPR) repeat protein